MNYAIVDAVNDLSGRLRPLDDLMIFAAKYLIFVAFAVFALTLLPVVSRRGWSTLAHVAATLGLAFLLGMVAASLHTEQRPFTGHHDIHLLIAHAPGQSFPSDHATAAFAMALAVLVFVSRRWGWLLVGIACVVSVARVYAGLHYLGDIAGSLAVVLVALGRVRLASAAIGREASGGRLARSMPPG